MQTLLVHRGLEQPGRIGPLYVQEVALLGACCLVVFLGVLFLRITLHISLGWFLAAPSLAATALLFARAWRQEENPTFLFSWLSFHYQQPRKIGISDEWRKRPISQWADKAINKSLNQQVINKSINQ